MMRGRALVAGGALVVLAVVVVVFVALGSRSGAASPWSTLDTADVHSLAFDPDDPERIYFGHHGGLLQSLDGGRTWQPSGLSDADAMSVRATAGGRIQIAGHELLIESTDGGATWQPVPNDLPGLDLHAFVVDPGDPDHAWAAVVGFGLYETEDAGRHWAQRQAGSWGQLVAYRDGDRAVLAAAGEDGLVRSEDGGTTWERLAYPGAPLSGGLAADPSGRVLYAGTAAGLRRSMDGGESWEETSFESLVLAVAVGPGDPLDVAVVDERTRFYRSPDGGESWPDPEE